MRTFIKGLLLALVCSSHYACQTLKPYEKEYLLSPLMDETLFSPVAFDYSTRFTIGVERLSQNAANASSGSSCPTCGG